MLKYVTVLMRPLVFPLFVVRMLILLFSFGCFSREALAPWCRKLSNYIGEWTILSFFSRVQIFL